MSILSGSVGQSGGGSGNATSGGFSGRGLME